jgi:hypothetical protein
MDDRMKCTPITSDERRPPIAPRTGAVFFLVSGRAAVEAADRDRARSLSGKSGSRGRARSPMKKIDGRKELVPPLHPHDELNRSF